MNNYLLAYDLVTLGELFPQLHSFIKQHKLIAQWSQPYHGIFLIKSDADFLTIVQTFDEFLARRVLHFICPISPGTVGGILAGDIWEWLKAPPHSGLGLLAYLQQQQN